MNWSPLQARVSISVFHLYNNFYERVPLTVLRPNKWFHVWNHLIIVQCRPVIMKVTWTSYWLVCERRRFTVINLLLLNANYLLLTDSLAFKITRLTCLLIKLISCQKVRMNSWFVYAGCFLYSLHLKHSSLNWKGFSLNSIFQENR